MNSRTARLKSIKRIINEYHITSQEQLLAFLQKEEVSVTQATLSRDLKLLKVGKVSDGNNGYYYTLPRNRKEMESTQQYLSDITRGFLSISFSANLCIMKTLAGHADTVAIALDNLELDEILGTIAGDDTILIVMKENLSSQQFLATIKNIIPELELE
ncbi:MULTISPECIES: arginine repressor [unclassified Oceanispirochaeta]|jgi:transcriptional regulator of arginine metabolism|uniref:arginine repressor n=1 Tax=unclassified Oceanispirochaeta TaxID=2635722 RepID=UPI000E09DAC8|nr:MULTISPECIES: ArgR family transcriptional regulator [unclassified Oceanispirochaeta]MBF9015608.1 ArgR family transcriptional regulator [Oceanispirochaeta sp. M2]NPD73382.1 ArgR family transcriptional regulator [Oceanispirochaeta sp. M1]RDG30857.1 ArgR family transcriptional regulator [Oceanispirochaeta sp. M1]